MSSNLARLWVALGLIGALVSAEIAVGLLDDEIPSRTRWPSAETELKSRQLLSLPGSVDVVLLGSSSIEAAVDPQLLLELTGGRVVYNSGLPRSSPSSHEVWLEEVVLEGTDPDLIILALPAWPALGEGRGPLTAAIADATTPTWVDRLLGWSDLVEHRGSLADWDNLRARQRLVTSGAWTDLGHQTGYYDRSGGQIPGSFPSYSELSMTGEQMRALESIVGEAAARDVELAILIEPGRYPGEFTPSEIRSYIRQVEGLALEWGVTFWDTYTRGWADSLYADEAHFNREGTVAYTTFLAGLLEQQDRATP